MSKLLQDHYRIGGELAGLGIRGSLSAAPGYFKIGPNAIGFGRLAGGQPAPEPSGRLLDALAEARIVDGDCLFVFDPEEVVHNLRFERYPTAKSVGVGTNGTHAGVRRIYYYLRPILPVALRRRLQRRALAGWDSIRFPRWPVDTSVENIMGSVLKLLLDARATQRAPFIWFWPEGYSACQMMTHDVETKVGRDRCSLLMDLGDAAGIKSCFNIVPEERYEVCESFLDEIRSRGSEIGLHGLNHDGHLFAERREFERRARKIGQYARGWGATGFRSPVLYRNLDWYDRLEFEYDMTIPNVAHLDPQRGGCATVFPYFIGKLLELPLTTIQDYSLFNILDDYSIDRWREQAEIILSHHGLLSFNIHPDYLVEERQQRVYRQLLEYLTELRDRRGVWTALPREVNRWWRQRAAMNLRLEGGQWRIEGEGSERATVAYANATPEGLEFEFEPARSSLRQAG